MTHLAGLTTKDENKNYQVHYRFGRYQKGVPQKLYTHKFDNLDKMEQFLVKLTQFTHYQIDNLNCPITIKKYDS